MRTEDGNVPPQRFGSFFPNHTAQWNILASVKVLECRYVSSSSSIEVLEHIRDDFCLEAGATKAQVASTIIKFNHLFTAVRPYQDGSCEVLESLSSASCLRPALCEMWEGLYSRSFCSCRHLLFPSEVIARNCCFVFSAQCDPKTGLI